MLWAANFRVRLHLITLYIIHFKVNRNIFNCLVIWFLDVIFKIISVWSLVRWAPTKCWMHNLAQFTLQIPSTLFFYIKTWRLVYLLEFLFIMWVKTEYDMVMVIGHMHNNSRWNKNKIKPASPVSRSTTNNYSHRKCKEKQPTSIKN